MPFSHVQRLVPVLKWGLKIIKSDYQCDLKVWVLTVDNSQAKR